jgi:hypothetical protein
MRHDVDLGYDPDSLLGPLDMARVQQFQTYLHECGQSIEFDHAYINHISKYHGGVPRKRLFKTAQGGERTVERFLNFVDYKTDKQMGWYNVAVTWTQVEDRLNDFLIPFAVLLGGDLLCFDFTHPGRPSVVVWLHEESLQDAPVTEFVARDFDDFLAKLYAEV